MQHLPTRPPFATRRLAPRRLSLATPTGTGDGPRFLVRTLIACAIGWLGLGAASAQPASPAPSAPPTTDAQPAAAVRHYDIPAGPLEEVLSRFGQDAGILLSFSAETTSGLNSGGLRGSHSVESALRALLSPAGLQAVRQPNGSYQLRRLPAPAADLPTLPPVTVTATAAGDLSPAFPGQQVSRGGSLGVLGNVDFMDSPYSQSAYTERYVRDQQAVTIGEALRADPTVMPLGAGVLSQSFQVRGFYVGPGGGDGQGPVQINGMFGLAPNYANQVAYAERIEVLRGPGALLTGIPPSGSVGGTVSIITKRAADEPLTRLGLDYASDSRFGATIDVGRRFGDAGQWGVRFNGRRQTGDTTIDGNAERSSLGALSLDYRGGNGLKVALDVVSQSNRDNRARLGYPYGRYGDSTLPPPPDPSVNPTDPAARSVEDTHMVQVTAQYQLNDRWDLFAGAGTSQARYQAIENYNYLMDRNGRLTDRALYGYDMLMRKQSYRAGLNGLVETGPILHQLTLSADGYHNRYSFGGSFDSPILPDGNIYQPAFQSGAALLPNAPRNRDRYTDLDSVALVDTLSLLDDRVRLIVGLRHQRIKVRRFDFEDGSPISSYDRSAVTPTFGAVFKPRSDVSLYASVIEGLRQGDIGPGLNDNPDVLNPGEALPPYKTRQYEVGMKYDGKGFGMTAAVYRISEPSAAVGPDNYFRINGTERHDGLEVVVFGELTPGVRLLGGFSYIRARLVETPDGALEGKRPIGVPAFQVKVTPEWDIPTVPGLTGWVGVRHTAKRYADEENRLAVPAYTLWDAGFRYGTRMAGKDVMLRASVLNLADKAYWEHPSGWSVGLGTGRTVLLSASVDF